MGRFKRFLYVLLLAIVIGGAGLVLAVRLSPWRAVVWVHGGAWIAGRKEGVANYLRVIAGGGHATLGLVRQRPVLPTRPPTRIAA